MEEAMKFKVFVRVRPAADGQPNGVCKVEHRIITVHDPSKNHSSEFVFDRVFPASGPDSSQETIFQEVGKPLVEHALQGYNACCFAYGQTGSGKTYSMFGKETGEHDQRGMIPRSVEELFRIASQAQQGQRYVFFVSFLEIYLEQVRDLGRAALLVSESGGKVGKRELDEWSRSNLDVMEDASGQTSVKDLTFIEAANAAAVLKILSDGASLRSTAATSQNDVSSRSHTVFTISVVQYRDGNKPVTGRLHLVDLAGSERQSKSNSEGQRLTEAKAINKSLTALGKVIMSLSSRDGDGKGQHVPFRDCKLTRILKDSLQGNSLTCMLAALNPLPDNAEECFNTLQFGVRCQNIDLAPRINVVSGPGQMMSQQEGDGIGMGMGMGEDGMKDDAVAALMEQVIALQEELDFTHAHYQKILEQAGGAGWTANMGNIEHVLESGAVGATSLGAAISATRERADSFHALTSARRSIAGDGSRSRPGSGAQGGAAWGAGGAEQKMKRLEQQLELAKSEVQDVQSALGKKRVEFDEMRERLLGRDRQQFGEIRKLRNQVTELTAKLGEQQVEQQHKSDESSKKYEEEMVRLHKDNEKLRSQLAQVTSSLSGIVEARGARTMSESKAKEVIRAEAERSTTQQMNAIVEEKTRQVNNIKQQSEFFLRAKAADVEKLSSELSSIRTKHKSELAGLQIEYEYLADYTQQLLASVRGTEQNVYQAEDLDGDSTQALNTAFRITAKGRLQALEPARLQHLMDRRRDVAQGLVEGSKAVAEAPALLASRPSGSVHSKCDSSHRASMQSLSLRSKGSVMSTATASNAASVRGTETNASLNRTMTASSLHAAIEKAVSETDESGTGPDIEVLKQQWESELRERITGEVVSELQDNKTVEYIRSLEAAVERYRSELMQERQRTNQQNVVLRSVQRAANRPTSALNVAIQGEALLAAAKWGHGHSHLTGSPAGSLAGSLTLAPGMQKRPATASPRLGAAQGSFAGGPGPGTGYHSYGKASAHSRPTSATAMQMLTSAYHAHGLQS